VSESSVGLTIVALAEIRPIAKEVCSRRGGDRA